MIPVMLDAARTLGKRAGRAGRPVNECPYATDGGGDQRAAARAWVGQWLLWSGKPPAVNFDDEPE